MSDLIEPPPQPTGADRVYQAAKVGMNLVPVVGGAAAELVESVLGPPFSRRQHDWLEVVADAIRTLKRQQIPVDSDKFVTAIVHASRIALGIHLDEKLEMLKAAIIHCALPDRPSDVMTMRLLRFVDELDPEHFVVLAYFSDPGGHFDCHGIHRMPLGHKQGGALARSPRGVLDFAELPVTGEDVDIVVADLLDRNLLDPQKLKSTSVAEEWGPVTSLHGDQLLDFVTYIEPPVEEPEPN